METIRINVGGTVFETSSLLQWIRPNVTVQRDTLNALSNWKLSDDHTLSSYYRENENDFFFDRDPVIFGAILNYLRTSELHLPTTRCGPSIKAELKYWKVNQKAVQRCCWTNYNKWNSTVEAMAKLERDRKAFSNDFSRPEDKCSNTFWPSHRARVWTFLNRSTSSIGAKIFGVFSLVFVVLSITTFVLSTTNYFDKKEQLDTTTTTAKTSTTDPSNVICTTDATDDVFNTEKYHKHDVLDIIDITCLVYFLLEYVIRLIYSPRKLHFIVSFLSIVDVVALVPDIIEYVVFPLDSDIEASLNAINFVTFLRVLRICRIFRLIRHSTGLWMLIYTLKSSISELLLLVWLMMIGVVFFASLIHVAEDKKDFNSIPEGFWWAIITMTTVGYGDFTPKTAGGKVIGSFCAMLGVLVIGFSVPSLVNNFMMFYSQIEFANIMEEKEKSENDDLGTSKKTKNNNNVDFEELTTQL